MAKRKCPERNSERISEQYKIPLPNTLTYLNNNEGNDETDARFYSARTICIYLHGMKSHTGTY